MIRSALWLFQDCTWNFRTPPIIRCAGWDDERRFELLSSILSPKPVLFGNRPIADSIGGLLGYYKQLVATSYSSRRNYRCYVGRTSYFFLFWLVLVRTSLRNNFATASTPSTLIDGWIDSFRLLVVPTGSLDLKPPDVTYNKMCWMVRTTFWTIFLSSSKPVPFNITVQ
jgi:hypothetical protein